MAFGSFRMGAAALGAVLSFAWTGLAEDWPTYMHDPARSGVSGETLPLPLAALWNYTPPAEPKPAWGVPQPGWTELPKLNFDDAFHVAAAGDAVYFGSSVDNAVHALDAATGAPRWTFFTEGPVRLAPSVADGRVYFGSDDGRLYGLEARDGRLAWSVRPFPGEARLLGAGRLMSLWPVRTGVVAEGGVVYCGAGLFPSRGTAMFAMDAKDGRPLWKTSQIPRESYVTLAPMGYLLASPKQVYVPNGRTSPLTYARADGALCGSMTKDYDIVGAKGVISGGYGILINDLLYMGSQNVLHGYTTNGAHAAVLKDARQLVATPDRYFRLSGQPAPSYGRNLEEKPNAVTCIDRAAFDRAERRGTVAKEAVKWVYKGDRLQAMIVAGSHVIVGAENAVIALDAATGAPVWQGALEGRARGLAVANGRLLVSTDKGRIFCFGKGSSAAPAAPASGEPFAADADTPRLASLAAALAKDAGLDRGYGLVLGADAARLAFELSRKTGMLVHAVEPDPVRAEAARRALSAARAYGTKVLVDVVAPGGTNGLPYPTYFANLIVVNGPLPGGPDLLRLLKPCGGVLYARGAAPDPAWAKAGAVGTLPAAGGADWSRLVRGPLPGARDWTHQYANAGNTASSDDERMRGRPEVLWYGEPGPDKMQDRHVRSEAPLSLDGRIYVQGLRFLEKTPILMCFDAYNGVSYWERPVPGAQRINITGDCGNLAASRAGLFVAVGSQCLQLDLATGATLATYPVPARPGKPAGAWSYVAVDGGFLVGGESATNQFSRALFAYDLKTGKLAWSRETAPVRNATLALLGGRLFGVENRGPARAPASAADAALAKAAERRGEIVPKTEPVLSVRTVVARDLATGGELWAKDVELTGCGSWGGNLSLIAKDGVLLLCGIYSAYGKPKGDEDQRRGMALSALDGAALWDRVIGNRVRPVVVKDTVIARPRAFQLKTGAPVTRTVKNRPQPWGMLNSGACGQISASAGLLFYRDGITAVTDVETGARLLSFTGMRPGCLINIVPAGGVAVQVESSSGCACAHALQGTIAFAPADAK